MPKRIVGYAVRFGEETTIAGLFREKIAPNAFDQSLRERPDVLGLWSHDPARVLGRTSSGTLELRTDSAGLWFSIEPDPNAPDGATALSAVARADVRGCSFGFVVERETWDEGADNQLPLRIIERAELLEVSVVSWPAYPTTTAKIAERSGAPSPACRISERQVRMEQKFRGIRAP